MDLHDYDDVAANYDYYLQAIGYNKNYLKFNLELAKKHGQEGIIDIACGTGELTMALAREKMDVTAVDLSQAMINQLQKKQKKENVNINLLVSNMTSFKCNRLFSLATITHCGFMHLTTSDEQRQALLNIRNHLTDDGILTLNTFAPDIRLQYKQINTVIDDYTLRCEYINHKGQKEKIYNAITYDPITQIMNGNWKFETFDENDNIIDTRIRPLAMRQTYKQEMEYLIEICGFEVVNLYGGYNKEDSGNTALIWVLRKVNK